MDKDGKVIEGLALNSLSVCMVARRADSPQTSSTSVSIGVDSCAGLTVWPESLCDDVDTVPTVESRRGDSYFQAGEGQPRLANLGQRKYELQTSDGRSRQIKVTVAKVRRPLLAVSEMVDAGHRVVFEAKGAYAEHTATGRRTTLVRRNGIYEMEVKVRPGNGRGQAQP